MGPHRADAEIEADIRRHLEWDTFVPHGQIHTSVSDGVVTLRGAVDYTSQRLGAADAVRAIAGVHEVRNEITVNEPAVAPHVVRASILDALERHALHEMRQLQLDITDGCVTVTGAIHCASERRAIIGAITGIPGVETVIDQLHIVP